MSGQVRNPLEYVLPPYCCECLTPDTTKYFIRGEGLNTVTTFSVYLCRRCRSRVRLKLSAITLLPLLVGLAVAYFQSDSFWRAFWFAFSLVVSLIGLWLSNKGLFQPAVVDGVASIRFRSREYQARFEQANSQAQ